MRRDIVFVHIPKTSGTSLRAALQTACKDHLILRDYDDVPQTTPELFELVYRQRRLPEFRRRFDREGKNGILLSGHFPAKRYWEFFNAESFVTFIRNPVDRTLSEFNHFVAHEGWKAPVEEFILAPRFQNAMSRILANVDLAAFGFIGIMEEFDRSMNALRDFTGLKLPMRNENVGTYPPGIEELRSRSDIRAMIAEHNRADLDMYEKLRAARSGAPLAVVDKTLPAGSFRGRVRAANDASVSGWVCNTKQEFICDVEIRENDRVIGHVKADLYRENIKPKGFSRSGVCGFRLDRQTLSAMGAGSNGILTFKVRGTDYELPGSPVRLGEPALTAQPMP